MLGTTRLGLKLLMLVLLLVSPAVAQDDREVQVNVYSTGSQQAADVARMANGDFMVVWESTGGLGTDTGSDSIQGRFLDSTGAPHGGDFQVNSYTTFDQREPRIVQTSDASMVVAWDGRNTPAPAFRRFTSTGVPVGEDVIMPELGNATEVTLAPGVNGSFLVVWDCFHACLAGGENRDIIAQRYGSLGDPLTDPLLINVATSRDQLWPRVATLGDNGFIIVWQDNGQLLLGDETVVARRVDSSGMPFGDELLIGDPAFDRAHQVTSNGSDEFAVAWTSSPGLKSGIATARHDSFGVQLGEEYFFAPGPFLRLAPTSVLADASGNLSIAFTRFVTAGPQLGQYDGGLLRYDSQGAEIDSMLQVNTYHHEHQDGGRLAPSDSGVLIVWRSEGSLGQDDSGWSVQTRSNFSAIYQDAFETGTTHLWHEAVGESP